MKQKKTQMNTSRSIFVVCLMLFIPLVLNAQVPRSKPAEMPKKKIVLSSGDTTIIVNRFSEGLNSKDAEFLYRDLRFKNEDLFPNEHTKYQSLEEAAYDVNRLMNVMQTDMKRNRDVKVNRSLGYRVSQVERMKNENEKTNSQYADSLFKKNDDPMKLVKLREKFGNQPTYYLNGLIVDYAVIEYLYPEEIMSRTIKVTNTISGNPNGEIWYKVPDKVLLEIGLVKLDAEGKPYVVGDRDKNIGESEDVLDYISVGRKKKQQYR